MSAPEVIQVISIIFAMVVGFGTMAFKLGQLTRAINGHVRDQNIHHDWRELDDRFALKKE